jgi:group I intron endonuclease
MIGIYKITNPKGKIYIGQSINIEKRWKRYKDWINHSQPIIYRSFQKYGLENHKFEIIEECNIEILDEKEVYWKQYYLDLIGWDNVLFCQLKDGKGGYKTQETKDKISKSKTGFKCTEETKALMRISNKNRILPDDYGAKISKAKKGVKVDSIFTEERNSKLRKPIIQFDKKGNFIEEYISYKEARRITEIKMTEAVRGKTKTAGGYIWKKKEDLTEINYDFINKKLINGL